MCLLILECILVPFKSPTLLRYVTYITVLCHLHYCVMSLTFNRKATGITVKWQ